MRDFLGFFTFVGLTLLTLFIVWYGLQFYGASRPLSNYQTPLSKELKKSSSKKPLLWKKDPSAPYLWLESFFEKGHWFVAGETPQRLVKFMENTINEQSKILLFFSSKDSQALPSLRKYFKESHRWQRIIFCSRFDGLLKDLRELEPRWTFCSGENYMTRILAFASLKIESLLEISADIVFIHTQIPSMLSSQQLPSIIAESQRQNKLIFIGPISMEQLSGLSESLKPNGWVVRSRDQKVQ